jgi:uncharacterized membrane protein YfcA
MDEILVFALVGFAAQLVDGALGMAYGITATSAMLSLGVAPAVASASVHAAEVVTTGVSGLAHWQFGNVDRELFRKLVIPGMIGGAIGAYLLASIPSDAIRPLISVYLLVMGLIILHKAIRRRDIPGAGPRHLSALGFGGGFLDAMGGGGWGPIVASTLLGNGTTPRYAIGSVNVAEFFVAATVSAAFVFTIGLTLWPIIAGLILGGALAAPFAAYMTRRLPERFLMVLVATVVIALSVRGLIQDFS